MKEAMIDSIDMEVPSIVPRKELRQRAGINVHQCDWLYTSGYRPGSMVPIIMPNGAHPICRRAHWIVDDRDGTVGVFSSRRALIPSSAVRFKVKADSAREAWDMHLLKPANQGWLALGCSYAVDADQNVSFKLITSAAMGNRLPLLEREPLIVPAPAWGTWLDTSDVGGTYPPRPGSIEFQSFVRH